MFVCCLCVFCFYYSHWWSTSLRAEQTLLIFNCNTCNTRTPGGSTCQLTLATVSSAASDIFERTNRTDSSFIHVLKPIHLLVFFLLRRQSHTAFAHFPKEQALCPKECVYKLPINTLPHALMHANKHAHQQCTSPCFSLWAILSASVRHAPSSQPRRGTFGSSFSGKKKTNKENKAKKTPDVIFCHLLFLYVQTVQFGNLPGTKTSQHVKVPTLFFPFI